MSELCINEINDAKKAADNIVKAIEQGIITDFTKERLTTLQNEVNNLDIEINREMQKTYALLSIDEVEKYLLSKVFENPDDIKTRKLLVNTFIREIIWYGDKLVITYNFQEEAIPPRLTKSHTEEVEKQVEEAARSASSFSLGSYIFWQTAPLPESFDSGFFTKGLSLHDDSVALCSAPSRVSPTVRLAVPLSGARCKASPVVRTTTRVV